jgi:hypothetical protein
MLGETLIKIEEVLDKENHDAMLIWVTPMQVLPQLWQKGNISPFIIWKQAIEV